MDQVAILRGLSGAAHLNGRAVIMTSLVEGLQPVRWHGQLLSCSDVVRVKCMNLHVLADQTFADVYPTLLKHDLEVGNVSYRIRAASQGTRPPTIRVQDLLHGKTIGVCSLNDGNNSLAWGFRV